MATNGEACGLSLFCARRCCYRRRVCPGYRPFRRRFRRSGWPDVSRRVPSRSCGSHTRKARRSGGRSTRTRPRWTSRCWPALDGERLYRVARIERVDALVGGMLDGGRHRHRGLRAKRPVALSFTLSRSGGARGDARSLCGRRPRSLGRAGVRARRGPVRSHRRARERSPDGLRTRLLRHPAGDGGAGPRERDVGLPTRRFRNACIGPTRRCSETPSCSATTVEAASVGVRNRSPTIDRCDSRVNMRTRRITIVHFDTPRSSSWIDRTRPTV